MQDEIDSLAKNSTWFLSGLPPGRNAIKYCWLFKLKKSGSGHIFKTRLVAKGSSQKSGIDYEDIYSPLVKHDALRTVLAIAAAKDLHMVQLDVKTTFLNGELEEELYMEQSAGSTVSGKETQVCRLQKSLYGLKQASRCWNEKFNGFLLKYWFSLNVSLFQFFFCSFPIHTI